MLNGFGQVRVVGEAADGLEAVQKAQELKPDLILLDISLPNLNGIEVASRICQVIPGTKIIFLTVDEDAEVVQAALSNGAQGYVLKVNAGSELLPTVEEVIRGREVCQPGTAGLRPLAARRRVQIQPGG
jgi:DNA-binding NarL/FixJ family response regulator